MSINSKYLGDAIAQARKKAGFTQEELAALVKIDSRNFQKYEAGALMPRYATLFKIAEATDTSALELLKPMWEDWKKGR